MPDEIQAGGRQNGKTSAMLEQMLKLLAEYEEAAEAGRLHVLCHPDEHERLSEEVQRVQAHVFAPRRITITPSPFVTKGTVYTIENRYLSPATPAQPALPFPNERS